MEFVKHDYWYWTNVFSKKDIKELNNFIEKNFDQYEDKIYHAREKGISKKNALVKCICFKKIYNYLEKIDYNLRQINLKFFGYALHDNKLYDYCNLNIYSSKKLQNYDWHIDSSNSTYEDIKLTLLINLSVKKYEGGNFLIRNNGEYEVKEINTPGNAVAFKSFLNHKVLPITKGERRTLAIFYSGPSFK